MSTYLIGDLQGCNGAFLSLLQKIDFSPSRDRVYLLGDLVNRGPASADVLRQCMEWGDAVFPLLGNHDLHLLAMAYGVRKIGRRDTLENILQAKDCKHLLSWVSNQPLARFLTDSQGKNLLMVHAGVLPQWSLQKTLALADEIHTKISGPDLEDFLQHMYGNTPATWSDDLTGYDRLRVIVNALTRIRFCTPQGEMDFESSESADAAPAGLVPWFECPQRQTADTTIAFGHWSTLGLINQPHLIALDTGCVWGGCLTALEIGSDFRERRLHQVACEQAQKPGQ